MADIKSGWSKRPVAWTEGNEAFVSVVFSWHIGAAKEIVMQKVRAGYDVSVGGPAVAANPQCLNDMPMLSLPSTSICAVHRHNPLATFTSRGCPNKCKFCIVPKIEGDLVELEDWPIRPVVCDNNLLACSKKHFDSVIDKLKPLRKIDFNQGLDARLLTKHHADRLGELDCMVRLAWDHIGNESQVMSALDTLSKSGIKPNKVRVFVLFGYDDTPGDALYRVSTLKKLGYLPNPMRYQPINATKKNDYVANRWTERELKRFGRYWSRQIWLSHIPYEDYIG